MLPDPRAVDALKAFRAEFPAVSLRLSVESLGAVTQMVLDRTATIGICGALDEAVAGIERITIGRAASTCGIGSAEFASPTMN